ncbi:MAG: hypothetical protein R3E68_07150 [Burkholderiaceae bacterium]
MFPSPATTMSCIATRARPAVRTKKVEFLPKFGPSPLFDHPTRPASCLSDPPLHALRVRRLIMEAVNQRAVSRMEPALHRWSTTCWSNWPTRAVST